MLKAPVLPFRQDATGHIAGINRVVFCPARRDPGGKILQGRLPFQTEGAASPSMGTIIMGSEIRPAGAPEARQYTSGIEGREAEMGLSVAMVMRTLSNHSHYSHEVNDALVKAHLLMLQFAKNHGLWAEFLAHDVKTMEPVNRRLGKLIAETGDREHALTGLTDDNTCHYQLVLDTKAEPGRRTWVSPYRRVLEVSRRIGQFDLSEREIHERYTVPRLMGYAAAMGVEIRVSPWAENGVIVLELA